MDSEQTRAEFAAWGAAGGRPGQPASVTLVRASGERLAVTKARMDAVAGDRLVLVTGGGGGHGDPRLRDRAAVERDIREGKVSLEAARDAYGWDPPAG
jgi:N-methylhydantoinase B